MGYFFLGIIALYLGFQDLCMGGLCGKDFIGRSWFLWGALFYVVIGFLCLIARQNKYTKGVLVGYIAIHAGLIVTEYIKTQNICLVCTAFLLAATLLALFYWLSPSQKKSVGTVFALAGPARVLAVILLALLVANPVLPDNTSIAKVAEEEAQPAMEPQKTGNNQHDQPEIKIRLALTSGEEQHVDLEEKPVLYFATWCDKCDDVLKVLSRLPNSKRPHLVATYLQGDDITTVKQKLTQYGLDNEQFYLSQEPPDGVHGLPALVYAENGKTKIISGRKNIIDHFAHLLQPIEIGYAELRNPLDNGGKNANLAASLVNGVIINPGEIFSFNQIVGQRTVSRGFVEGQSVVNTVYGPELQPSVGGGICRTATVIHHAVLTAGLEVVERHDHSLPVSYAEPGKDAAVAYGYLDYRFRNNTEWPIKLQISTENEKLRVVITSSQF